MGTWLRRLAYLFRQSRHDAELREEIEAHRALRAAHLERDGLTSQEAADASRRAIGNVLLAREDVREVWLGSWATWWQDVRYGLRTLPQEPDVHRGGGGRRSPWASASTPASSRWSTACSFATCPRPTRTSSSRFARRSRACRISPGQETFSDVRVLRLSRPRADALRTGGLWQREGGNDARRRRAAQDLRRARQLQLLHRAAAASGARSRVRRARLRAGRGPRRRARSRSVADGVCGGPRDRRAHDRTESAALSRSSAWPPKDIRRLAYSAAAISRRSARAGCCAPGDSRYEDEHVSLAESDRPPEATDVGVEQVRAELDVIAAQIDRQQPGRSTMLTIERARPPLPQQLRGGATGAAAVLMAAFGLILLIACANVANLLLARGTSRSQEIGIRVSLGASRARVVRQLVTESLLISVAGGLLGSAVAVWSFQTLVALAVPALLPPVVSAGAHRGLEPRPAGALVRGGADDGNGHPVRTCARVARLQAGSARRDEAGVRGRRQQPPRRAAAGDARRRAGGAVHGVDDRGRTPAARVVRHLHDRSRLRIP